MAAISKGKKKVTKKDIIMAKKTSKKKGKLPTKYIKKYGISAKAWKEYRKGSLSGSSAVKKKKVIKRKVTKKRLIKSVTTGAVQMAKRKRKYTKRRKTRRLGSPGRSMRLIKGNTVNAIVDGFLVGGGAVGTTFAMNMIPFVKDQKAWIKALIQAGIGSVGIGLFKDKYVKKLMAGAVAGAAISLIIPFMPDSFKFSGGRDFTEAELEEIQSMGVPVSITDRSMSGPVRIREISENAAISGRGRRRYAY